ncbi:GNAT family N-acetyltransferase [Paenarthrobacter sp. DKR-5]|uniref:GNAT family N-acetyltransferase n=1 Tax=Paenarthrobacter sp. DKR-5 TaxID=2835535 RepID=UPI001BDDB462|nr:GNAT family N-acetyltransferase [Paenarthrobacter sp. DKR-5]MBT1003715.1 GNAT family N-acetyltransferase [Paenarthrobacter sp. DKR-5]
MPEFGPLLHRAWPAPHTELRGGWVLRSAEGVTQRANSVWPAGPVEDLRTAVDEAESYYKARRLPPIFQVLDEPAMAALDAELDRRRYTRQSRTLIQTARVEPETVEPELVEPGTVELADAPSGEWLDLWWHMDGRTGGAGREVAVRILTGCPALYASARTADGQLAAVGRLALVGEWGGLYCMATAAAHRRQGHARRVARALMSAGAPHGVRQFWLLVTEANTGARELYEQLGFTTAGRYLFRQAPLRRFPAGC